MDKSPRISIGLPVYNGERYLATAIESVLNQTFQDFELIISSNASTDFTDEICRSYAAKDARIQFERLNENVGAAANFNRVFHRSRGEYFKWAAHDDICMPSFFQRCMETLDAAPENVVLCMPKVTRIDQNGVEVTGYDDGLELRQRTATSRMIELARRVLACGCHSVFGVVRTAVMRRTRLIAPFVASDAVLLGDLAAEGELWEIPEPLFHSRTHDECSHRKFKTLEEYAAWYAPVAKQSQVKFLRTKLASEIVRGIWRSSMPS